MKLVEFSYLESHCFQLSFEDGSVLEADLSELLRKHLPLNQIHSARIDPDWGCLEFNEGRVDITPQTLLRFVINQKQSGNCL
jgi:hypothetical protein